ncbi:hypothetical protein DENSPDRAFT_891620 [Dentipellis sp. KUC8613]|nr:hypothetical protein DENSPDRAFT_891620 [Dentipellis sp. KUC8613]
MSGTHFCSRLSMTAPALTTHMHSTDEPTQSIDDDFSDWQEADVFETSRIKVEYGEGWIGDRKDMVLDLLESQSRYSTGARLSKTYETDSSAKEQIGPAGLAHILGDVLVLWPREPKLALPKTSGCRMDRCYDIRVYDAQSVIDSLQLWSRVEECAR